MGVRGLFVTGTDTDVGKTVACAWLLGRMDADYWKPVQAGLQGETDTEAVERLSGLPRARFHPWTSVVYSQCRSVAKGRRP